jgi:ABC-type uncharacterized transport system ATPase subunit
MQRCRTARTLLTPGAAVLCRLAAAPDHAPQLGEGKLELIMGPMFAGKTTALIDRVSKRAAVLTR